MNKVFPIPVLRLPKAGDININHSEVQLPLQQDPVVNVVLVVALPILLTILSTMLAA